MAIPFRPTGMVGFSKELDSRTRCDRTDIERLMRLLQQQSEGEIFGNDPANPLLGYPGYGSGGSGASGKIYEGKTTGSGISRPATGDGWTVPTTGTVLEYDEDPSNPGVYILTGNSFTITNRDENLAIGPGMYVHFVKVTTQNGNTEYRITWVSR